jgi:hypothetical protein
MTIRKPSHCCETMLIGSDAKNNKLPECQVVPVVQVCPGTRLYPPVPRVPQHQLVLLVQSLPVQHKDYVTSAGIVTLLPLILQNISNSASNPPASTSLNNFKHGQRDVCDVYYTCVTKRRNSHLTEVLIAYQLTA